jgi:3-oxoacyl-[acyl-carrier protein] reductase
MGGNMAQAKVAVVTAASKGIGAATAIAFGEAGYDVVVNYRSSQEDAAAVVAKIKAAGQDAMAVQADVFTESGVQQLFEAVRQRHETIDVLVNNAGYAEEPGFEDWTFAVVAESLAANFSSAVMCTQAAVPLMKQGSILFNASIYGLDFGGNPGLALYSAGKAAIINFTQTMAEKLGPTIRCNVVAPGVTKTPAWDGATPEYIELRQGMSLQKEWVQPSEIGKAFVFLAETPHMNAQTITVDGGYMKKFPPTTVKRK